MTDQVDVEIGARVHAAMWRTRVTQTQLAKHLSLDQAAVSRRLRGSTAWKVSELLRVSQLLHIAATELLPDAGVVGDQTAEVTSQERFRRSAGRHVAARHRRKLRLLTAPVVTHLTPVTCGM